MGQKVNPTAYRLQIQDTWKSRWFADQKNYKKFLLEDIKLRQALMSRLKLAGINRIDIERSLRSLRIILHVTRPGIVIGRGGTGMEDLKKYVMSLLDISKNSKSSRVDIRVEEVKNPDLSAYLVASKIAEQLERRIPHRRVVVKAMERVIQSGASGVKIVLAGRIGGAEISRKEKYHLGTIPLQTLRADIDYASIPSLTRSGYIGVKTWIFKEDKK
jgi:small subunit ribosomal protein S3